MSESVYGSEDSVYPQVGDRVKAGQFIGRVGASSGPHVQYRVQAYPLETLSADIHGNAEEKGFWSEPEMMDKYAAKLALVHSEVTEILEALRKDQGPEAVTKEFSDVIIRLLDLFEVLADAGLAEPAIDEILKEKIDENAARPPLHGHKWG